VISTGEHYHTLLSQRFDRTSEGRRIHFASALTLLGLTDGDNATNGHGYLDMVDFILQHCSEVEWNLRELYRRVAFNILIGNTDDHFRNHGFLLTPKGWTLSPAYDMNPTLSRHQSLMISEESNESDVRLLLGACESYMLPRATAEQIITEVETAVSAWRELAVRLGISKREIDWFAGRMGDSFDWTKANG
jgi:serine/threonine-protein kinase HipA